MIFRGAQPSISVDEGPILIVDDQPDHRIRELAAKQFAGWGYAVFVVQDAQVGVALFQEVAPSLVVIGEISTGMSAPVFLERLKACLEDSPPLVSLLIGTWHGVALLPPVAVSEFLDFRLAEPAA